MELGAALRRIAGGVNSEEAAAALIRRLDRDKDGEITVEGLEAFLDKYANRVARAEARLEGDDAPLPGDSERRQAKRRQESAAADAGGSSDSDSDESRHGPTPGVGR